MSIPSQNARFPLVGAGLFHARSKLPRMLSLLSRLRAVSITFAPHAEFNQLQEQNIAQKSGCGFRKSDALHI
jgi:hypothetical protein